MGIALHMMTLLKLRTSCTIEMLDASPQELLKSPAGQPALLVSAYVITYHACVITDYAYVVTDHAYVIKDHADVMTDHAFWVAESS